MFLTWKPQTNTISRRHLRWRRSSTTRKSLAAVQSGCSVLSIVKQGNLMVVANIGDSQVVLGTASDDDVITPSSSSST
jgi:serine/threonine protein phosphatase PrpC